MKLTGFRMLPSNGILDGGSLGIYKNNGNDIDYLAHISNSFFQ